MNIKPNFIASLEKNEKLKKVLLYCVIGLTFAYIFSLPSFSSRPKFNYVSYALLALLAIGVLAYWFIYKTMSVPRFRFFILPIFAAWALIGTAVYTKLYREWATIVLLIISMYILYLAFRIIGNSRLIIYIIVGAFFLFSLYFLVIYRNDIVSAFKSGKRLGGYFDNENYIGTYSALGVLSSLFVLFTFKNKKELLCIIPLFSLMLIGYLCGSRTFVVALVVTVITFLCIKLKKKPLVLVIALVLLVALCIVIINLPFMAEMKKKFIESIYTVFGLKLDISARPDGSTANRILWQRYAITMAAQSPLIGYGSGGFATYSGVGTYCHGDFAEVLCSFGVPGAILFYTNLIMPLCYYGQSKDKSKIIIIPLVAFFIACLILDVWFYKKSTFVFFALMYFLVYKVNLPKNAVVEPEPVEHIKVFDKKHLNIIFAVDSMGSGGAEKVVSVLSSEFVKFGHDVSILAISSSSEESFYKLDEKVKMISLIKDYKKKVRPLKRLALLKQYFRKTEPDVVISFCKHICVYTYFAVGEDTKLILSERNDPNSYNFGYKLILKSIFRSADGCVFQTEDARKWYKLFNKNTRRVILNPIEVFTDKRHKEENSKRIFTVCRLEPQKNLKLLVDSFEIFSQKHKDYKLFIYGDGSLKDEINNYIVNKNFGDKIFLLGKENNWHLKEVNSACFVLSSDYEGLPNALAEALLLGIPCVSTDCPIGGPRELSKLFPNLILSVNDPLSMSNAIGNAIHIQPENVEANPLSKEIISAQWIELIENTIDGENKHAE